MCTSKPPKPKEVKEKEPQYMRNPWLDSLSMTHSGTVGRNALRVDAPRAPSTARPPSTPPPALPPPSAPWIPSMNGSGGGGGGGGNGRNSTLHPPQQLR